MREAIKLTDIDLQIIDHVVAQFIHFKKPTPRRKLLLQVEDPDILETLINRGLLRDVNRQAVLPTLLAFHFYRNKIEVQLAKESLQTIFQALRVLYLSSEEDRQITPSDIKTKAQELGRHLNQDALWLGLYLIQNYFNIWSSSSGSAETDQLNWIVVSEGILKFKDLDKLWDVKINQELEWLNRREAYSTPRTFEALDEDLDTFSNDSRVSGQLQNELLIFISHSSKDADIALGLIELLKAALNLKDKQIRCTSVDGFRLPAGAKTDDVLKAEVHQSKSFIGLITPNSLVSAYVLFELGARWGGRQHMAPVLAGLGPEALQGPLQGINSVAANNRAQLHQLLSELADTLDLELQKAAGYANYIERLVERIETTYRPSPPKQNNSRVFSSKSHPQPRDERKLRALTREKIIEVSKRLKWNKQMPKWTVEIEGTMFPVRPLAFKAAGLLPNASATTHQAVSVLKKLGFQVYYQNHPDNEMN